MAVSAGYFCSDHASIAVVIDSFIILFVLTKKLYFRLVIIARKFEIIFRNTFLSLESELFSSFSSKNSKSLLNMFFMVSLIPSVLSNSSPRSSASASINTLSMTSSKMWDLLFKKSTYTTLKRSRNVLGCYLHFMQFFFWFLISLIIFSFFVCFIYFKVE